MEKIDKLLKEMSVAEKALLCSGRKFWFTRGIKKYGIKPYMVSDGPHGLRKQAETADHLGINASVKSTCFPVACVMSSTWDDELISQVGERIASEAKQEKVGIVLGPGANIKRSPLCGRNFEYYSEDPYLSGKCATALIKGIQKNGIGTSLKHFAVNNQENDRLRIDAVVDERALREIYLASFEEPIKEGRPYTVMCAYNQVNGEFASEHKTLLTDILRDEWGFDGYVMTDWGATNDRVKGLKSGLDLEMPGGSGESVFDIVNAVAEGKLEMDVLDTAVKRLLAINFKVQEALKDEHKFDVDEHHNFARKVASEGAVLLSNEKNILPLSTDKPLTIIGSLFKSSRYQGSGSSLINPTRIISPYDAFIQEGIKFKYAEGFSAISDEPDDKMIEEAYQLARNSDAQIVVFAGLTMFYESEGFDRKHMSLPTNQNILINKLLELRKDIIVVLYGGSPVELPWATSVDAILNMYLPGQANGSATLDLLFGKVNPSGKLAETYPMRLEDNPSYKYFPEGPTSVEYRESIFVGYRYYDTADIKVRYPFGHGLSYTTFEYSDIIIDKTEITAGENISVKCTVTNTGKVFGKEIVQLYVRALDGKIFRANKELKGYKKLALEPNQSITAVFELDARAFSYYNVAIKDWAIENGNYEILIGASSRDIRLSTRLHISTDEQEYPYDYDMIQEYYNFKGEISDQAFTALLGRTPPSKIYNVLPIRMITTTSESRKKWMGRLMAFAMNKGVDIIMKGKDENTVITRNFFKAMMSDNILRSFATASGGLLSQNMMLALIDMFNGKYFSGFYRFIKASRANRKYNKILLKLEN